MIFWQAREEEEQAERGRRIICAALWVFFHTRKGCAVFANLLRMFKCFAEDPVSGTTNHIPRFSKPRTNSSRGPQTFQTRFVTVRSLPPSCHTVHDVHAPQTYSLVRFGCRFSPRSNHHTPTSPSSLPWLRLPYPATPSTLEAILSPISAASFQPYQDLPREAQH